MPGAYRFLHAVACIDQPERYWGRSSRAFYRSGVMVSALTVFLSAETTPTIVTASPLLRNA